MITQADETLNYQEFDYSKIISLFPILGHSIILQYSMEGSFNMLPVKVYPTFIPKPAYKKMDLTLKASCRLPTNLRIKEMKLTFNCPESVIRTFFH